MLRLFFKAFTMKQEKKKENSKQDAKSVQSPKGLTGSWKVIETDKVLNWVQMGVLSKTS